MKDEIYSTHSRQQPAHLPPTFPTEGLSLSARSRYDTHILSEPGLKP